MLATLNQSLLLPLLAGARHDRRVFLTRYQRGVQASTLAGTGMALGLIAIGCPLIPIVYGPQFATSAAVLPWLALAQAMRAARLTPAVAAMALTDTRNLMWSNVARVSGLGGVVVAGIAGADLSLLAACGLLSEIAAMLVAAIRLERRHQIGASIAIWASVLAAGIATCFGIVPLWVLSGLPIWTRIPAMAGLGLAGVLVTLVRFRSLHPLVKAAVARVQRRCGRRVEVVT
jgi:O-antigen/teichoic acid export membrane protein